MKKTWLCETTYSYMTRYEMFLQSVCCKETLVYSLSVSLRQYEIIMGCSVCLCAPGTQQGFFFQYIHTHTHTYVFNLQLAGNNRTRTGRIYNTFMLKHLCCVPVGSNMTPVQTRLLIQPLTSRPLNIRSELFTVTKV